MMFLAGEASYRSENRILGNDFGRRSCLYPLLLSQIFKKKQFFKKKVRRQFFWGVEIFFQIFCWTPPMCEVFFRPRSRRKTQKLMVLTGEASYRLENRILGNDFGRRSCLYPLLLGQIFKKKAVLQNFLQIFRWTPPPCVKFFSCLRSRRKTQTVMFLAGEAS